MCAAVGVDTAVLAALAGPAVAHFCGHRIAAPGADGRFPAAQEASVARAIAEELDRRPVGYRLRLARERRRHPVGGGAARTRQRAERRCCRSRARSSSERRSRAVRRALGRALPALPVAAATVGYATDDAFLGDDVLYRYGTELAMGLALLRARFLDAEVRQLAVWDGGPARGAAGTAIDVDTWGAAGVRRWSSGWPVPSGARSRAPRSSASPARVVRAMLFGDVKGFSQLSDEQLPRFAEAVLGCVRGGARRAIATCAATATPGATALYVVLANVESAADCALELQAAMGGIDLAAAGLPPEPLAAPRRPRRARCSRCTTRLRRADVHGLPREPDGADRAGHAAATPST